MRLDVAPTAELEHANLAELLAWEWNGLRLGEICLPALRWVMRRHDLEDTPPVRKVLHQYLASAVSLAQVARDTIDRLQPRAVVVFNGLLFPEATVRAVARRSGLPVITHEVGLRPLSAFFSHQEATFRQLEPPARLELEAEESARLDAYLGERFEGRFSMAGIRFWPEIQPLPASLLEALGRFPSTVTVFTNVIFDTSQVHANTLFPSMFAWLDDLLTVIEAHGDTLFIVRAHPDEDRPGKASRQSVADWARQHGLAGRPNVFFFGPSDYVNSYALIERSKFVLVYNSSVGLEATLLGVPVLCAGRARFTQWPTVTFPASSARLRPHAAGVPQRAVARLRRGPTCAGAALSARRALQSLHRSLSLPAAVRPGSRNGAADALPAVGLSRLGGSPTSCGRNPAGQAFPLPLG